MTRASPQGEPAEAQVKYTSTQEICKSDIDSKILTLELFDNMSQSLASIKIHVVFSTKSRLPLLEIDIRSECYKYLASVAQNHGSKVYEVGGMEDHIHILLTLPRTVTISKLVEVLKSSTSRWIKTRKQSLSYFAWQTGYGAFSVSESQLPFVQEYIRNQQQHHQQRGFKDELLKLLQGSRVEFDEKYLWD